MVLNIVFEEHQNTNILEYVFPDIGGLGNVSNEMFYFT